MANGPTTIPASAPKAGCSGGLGRGLDRNIKSAYHWLCAHYRQDDRIFLFGFSRGAYTVRSLSGFIAQCGLLNLAGLTPAQGWARVDDAYRQGYRRRRPKSEWGGSWPVLSDSDGGTPKIHCLGVWDTVGALGVPDDLILFDLLFDRKEYLFHDTELRENVRNAFHAVALDEMRASFAPTLWKNAAPSVGSETRRIEQRWFVGGHGDVGGGRADSGLSDIALRWMIDHARECGLQIDEKALRQLRPNPRTLIRNSVSGFWGFFRTLPRAVSKVTVSGGADLHLSVADRSGYPPIAQSPYHATHHLATGEHCSVDIFAREHWNATGIWLEKGDDYSLDAEGEWLDWTLKSGPEGLPNSLMPPYWAHRVGDLLGVGEGLYQRWTNRSGADWPGTKRYRDAPWFALVGMVANQDDTRADSTPPLGETFRIGRGIDRFSPSRSGYLYCYANDAWGFYGNNRGSVRLRVTRLS